MNMDEATAALIFRLQIEDSEELRETFEGKGKGREGEIPDALLALQLHTEDLNRNSTLITDRLMARSIAQACRIDGVVLTNIILQDHDCAGDREVACKLSGVAPPAPIEPWTVSSDFLDEELLKKLNALYVSNILDQTAEKNEEQDANAPETSL